MWDVNLGVLELNGKIPVGTHWCSKRAYVPYRILLFHVMQFRNKWGEWNDGICFVIWFSLLHTKNVLRWTCLSFVLFCVLKVPVGALQESNGGEHNSLFGDWLWEDSHSCAAYLWARPPDKETPEKHMCFSRTHGGFGSTG